MIKETILKPSFFVVGAQKAGTTTFQKLFSKHPEIYLPKKKELRFFSYHYNKGLEWYLNKYYKLTANQTYKIAGEVDPGYLNNPMTAARIQKDLGINTKIIMILRQPVKRAYSAYNMYKKLNGSKYEKWTSSSFKDQLIYESTLEIQSNFIANGLYFKKYLNYKNRFGEKNIKIIIFEDFIGTKFNEVIKDVCEFLDISQFDKFSDKVHENKSNLPKAKWLNVIYSQSSMMKSLRHILKSLPILMKLVKKVLTSEPKKLTKEEIREITEHYFKEDIKAMENELGYHIEKWKI